MDDKSKSKVQIMNEVVQLRRRVAELERSERERRRAEEELLRSQKQLFQAQKMETLGSLVSGVAHEINNPTNLIMFNVPLLQKIWHDFQPILEKNALKEPDKKYGGLTHEFLKRDLGQLLSDMDMAANRIAKIIGSLKNFARPEDVADKKPMQVNEAVENAIRLAQATIKKSKINMKLDLGNDIPPMEGHLQSIEQILLNLTINAIQAINHDRGEIVIRTGYERKSGRVHVSISDNGRGIEPSISEKIFDPFVTDRQAEGGTGLGLSVTYNLVRAHEGEISFESQLGQGTTFSVFFPTKLKEKQAKIMVVDDDELIRNVLTEALTRDSSYVVEAASNGTEALIKLGTFRPDLLVLDIFMPGMDGVHLCHSIKEEPELSGMKVIIMTGYAEDPKMKQIAGMGFSTVYIKPFNIQDFVKEVGRILDD